MSQRQPKVCYWQDAPMPREQLTLFSTTLEERISQDHPVRVLDEIMSRLDWTEWEANDRGSFRHLHYDVKPLARSAHMRNLSSSYS